MALEIGKLFVSIGADLAGFQQGVAQVNTQMGKMQSTLMKHNKAIGGAMVGIGAAILGTGLASVKSFADMGDEVAKMAEKTGFSTVALSELRHAAELSGTSLVGIEKASRTLSGAIVDAGDGLETYTRAFERIGLSYEELAALSPEEQFTTVLTALGDVEDATIRTATASDLFGARMGTALLPMIADGSEAFAEMRQEAHDLGVVFDEEAAAKAEEMKDSVLRLEKAISGITIMIADNLIPAILPVIDQFTEWIKPVKDLMERFPLLTKIVLGLGMALAAVLVPLGMLMFQFPALGIKVITLGAKFVVLGARSIIAFLGLMKVAIAGLWAWAGPIPFVGIALGLAGVAAIVGSILKIKSFKYGGRVPGAIGEPVPIIAHGGEVYAGVGGGSGLGGGVTVNLYVDYLMGDRSSAERMIDWIREGLRGRQRIGLGEGTY